MSNLDYNSEVMSNQEHPNSRRPARGATFLSRMILVTLFLVLAAVLASGTFAYIVAIQSIEEEIEFAGQSLLHGLSGSIVTIIAKPGPEGELQVILNQSLAVDKEGRVTDAFIVSKDLTVLAAKDTSQVGHKYLSFASLNDLDSMQTVHLRGSGTQIASPVQWGQTNKRTLGYVVITLSEHAFAKARRGILISFSALFLVASLVTVFLTRSVLQRLLRPVVNLGDAARALAEGNSNYPLEAKGNDEIGVATQSFLQMRAAQRVFMRFSNPALVKEILDGRAPDVPVEAKLAVGFGDGVRFTDWSNVHTAAETSHYLSDYFTLIGQLVATYGGLIEKFMGDAVMTYYGFHGEASSQMSLQSLRAHIAMQHLLHIANHAFQHYHHRRVLWFRFGLAMGRCLMGPIGARGIKLDYTVVGETVNLASRLEGLASPGGLAIDRFTYLNVEGERSLESEGPTEEVVKGFVDPVCIYRVAGYRSKEENDRLRQTVLDAIRTDEVRDILGLTNEQFAELFTYSETKLMQQALALPLRESAAV